MYTWFELTKWSLVTVVVSRLSYLFAESNIVRIMILVQIIVKEIKTFLYDLKWI
jgi:hypothetical protein